MKKAALFSAVLGIQTAVIATSSNAQTNTVFIPMGGAKEILVVDVAGGSVVRKIKGVGNAHGLAATPDGRFLIAGNIAARRAGGAPPRKPAGVSDKDHAAHHGQSSDMRNPGKAMVGTVTIVRAKDGIVVRRVDVPGGVHHVAAGPLGKYVAVTHPAIASISVISLDTFGVVATIRTGVSPNYAVFSPDGGRIYVSNSGDGTISEVEIGRWRVRQSIKVGRNPEHLVLSPGGAKIYANNVGDGTVSVIDTGAGKVLTTIRVGKIPHGIDLANDGRTLLVAVRGENSLVAVDLVTGTKRRTSLRPAPYHLMTVKRSRFVYVSSARLPKLWVIDQRTLTVVKEIATGGRGHQFVQIMGR